MRSLAITSFLVLYLTFANVGRIAAQSFSQNPAPENPTEQQNPLANLFAEIADKALPKEKVYLHLDNTGYYHDDTIWFSAYLVNADGNTQDSPSKTLYVDLLNPGGEIISTRILKIKNGRAHGSFKLNPILFYSGYYEIRAYTKYMMNFGAETAFSRVIPIFDRPVTEGDYHKKDMRTYGTGKYKYIRKQPIGGKNFNLKFYPEGGSLIKGIPVQIAFEAADKNGSPLELSGVIKTDRNDSITAFKTLHEGKGVFTIIPGDRPLSAEVTHNGKTRKFELPQISEAGYALSVDNLANPDSIIVNIARNGTPNRVDTIGIILTSGGVMKAYSGAVSAFRKPLRLAFDRNILSPGVSEVTLIDSRGKKISDRMIFNIPDSSFLLNVAYKFDKESYEPYEAIKISLKISDAEDKPVSSPLSLSVRDSKDEIRWERNILSDLLLMSDIKGYISNPAYYFDNDDPSRKNDLDLLMMVQGWRKYPWESLTDIQPDNLRFKPETEGIEFSGTVKGFSNKPKPNTDVTAFIIRGNKGDNILPAMDMVKTDSLGKFSFTVDFADRLPLILTASKKRKPIDCLFTLDKSYIPEPRQYNRWEMRAEVLPEEASSKVSYTRDNDGTSDTPLEEEEVFKKYATENDKSVWLKEVEVKTKRSWEDNAREESRRKSIAIYDVEEETNALRDNGKFIDLEGDIHKFLMKINPEFRLHDNHGYDQLIYKGKIPLIIIDYQRMKGGTPDDYFEYKSVSLQSIKSITISEDISLKAKYCWNYINAIEADEIYSCVVMIETFPDKIIVEGGKGVHKTKIRGYSSPKEFYSPDYSLMQPEPDYRRTIYWNPEIIPDANGEATITFYNNSSCCRPKVDMQTVTASGAIGTSK